MGRAQAHTDLLKESSASNAEAAEGASSSVAAERRGGRRRLSAGWGAATSVEIQVDLREEPCVICSELLLHREDIASLPTCSHLFCFQCIYKCV